MKTLTYKYNLGQEGFVLVSDEEIKEGDWMLLKDSRSYFMSPHTGDNISKLNAACKDVKKIIFCSPNLNLDGIPVIEIGEDYKQNDDYIVNSIQHSILPDSEDESGQYWRGDSVHNLLKKSLNHPKRGRYSEEDILNAIEIGFDVGRNLDEDNPTIGLGILVHTKDSYIQSLNPIPVSVEMEAEQVCDQCLNDDSADTCYCHQGNYKTILQSKLIKRPDGRMQGIVVKVNY